MLGILGFIGFVKIHELPAEKILPYWLRHYLIFAKPIHYAIDKDFENNIGKKNAIKVRDKNTKYKIKELKKRQKQEKILAKAKRKYKIPETKNESKEVTKKEESIQENKESELSKKLSKLSGEQVDALLKLLQR